MKGDVVMFDVSITFLSQLIGLMPVLIIIYVIFDFLGSFFFGKR